MVVSTMAVGSFAHSSRDLQVHWESLHGLLGKG